MKYFKYIAILFACFAVACTTDDLGETNHKSDKVQFVGRVMPFTECNVGSRATIGKSDNEAEIKTMALVIFDKNLNCVYMTDLMGGSILNIDRGVKDENGNIVGGDFQGIAQDNLEKCYIYAIANFPELETSGLKVGNTVQEFMALTTEVKAIELSEEGINGLPMLGVCDETVDLRAGGTSYNKAFEVKLHSLYAKIVFTIKVDADQKQPETPKFTLTDVKVNNVVDEVDFNGVLTNPNVIKESGKDLNDGTNDGTSLIMEDGKPKVFLCSFSSDYNVAEDGNTSVSFYFYLPERYLRAKTAAKEYTYPFTRDEDMDYRQRFKPLLAQENATYVTFEGIYSDHQGHDYNVSYDIYLGNDNYGNFDIVANKQYNNSILIRGLANSDDQVIVEKEEKDPISIDHRVDVERVNPIIINFRRETLLDSHFEVRPLRIHKKEDYTGSVIAKVSVDYGTTTPTTNWIGLERSYGTGTKNDNSSATYITNGVSAGKRLYFTTDLTTNTLKNSTIIDEFTLSTDKDECIWIYVDECTETGDGVRPATIIVSYSTDNGKTYTDVKYAINQRKLFPVTFTNGTPNDTSDDHSYLIEYHEEYLHNYDAEDQYGQTEERGMTWGLPNVQLSYDYKALSFDNAIQDYFTKNTKPYYDFYITKHDNSASGTKRAYNGYVFCSEIINEVNGEGNHNTDPSDDINILNLSQAPKSAIEYCYNKNKRNEKGKVNNVEWYLPGIDEIEDIVMSEYGSNQKTYARFIEFQNNFYWSSQPAYIRNLAYYWGILTSGLSGSGAAYGPFYIDDVTHARATKVYYKESKYGYELSGVNPDNYYHAWYHIELGFWNNDGVQETGTFTESNLNIPLGTIDRQPGNLHRTDDMARVRCVKRITTQQ